MNRHVLWVQFFVSLGAIVLLASFTLAMVNNYLANLGLRKTVHRFGLSPLLFDCNCFRWSNCSEPV